MVNLFRKYQQPVMIGVTVLTIIAFVLLYNGTQFDRLGSHQSYKIYGRSVSQAEIDRAARRFQLARALGLSEFVFSLVGNPRSQDEAVENFVWNSFVLSHEAREMGITPPDSEVVRVLKGLPSLQTNGQFDPVKYQQFTQNMLGPNGFTNSQFEELLRDTLRLKRLMELVGSTVEVTPTEFRTLYTRDNQKTEVSLIRYKLSDFTADIEPTKEEIDQYYKDHGPSLLTDEKRVVRYVEIKLGDEEKKLTGKARMEALQKQSARAENLGQALLEPGADFGAVAEKMGLAVKTTPEFTAAKPPPEFAAVSEAAAAAFSLTKAAPESDPVESADGLLVLHLEKIIPRRPLTLEEAQPRVVEAIRQERGRNALTSKANATRAKITEALKAGKSFADAAAQAGAKPEPFPAFSSVEPAPEPFAAEVASKASELPKGGLSELLPTLEGGLLVYLIQRDPVDEAKLAQAQETQIGNARSFKRFEAFNEWLRLRLKEANPQSLVKRRAEGQQG